MSDEPPFPSLEGWVPNPFVVAFRQAWASLSCEKQLLCQKAALVRTSRLVSRVLSSLGAPNIATDTIRESAAGSVANDLVKLTRFFLKLEDQRLYQLPFFDLVSDVLGGVLAVHGEAGDEVYGALLGMSIVESVELCDEPPVDLQPPKLFASFESRCEERCIWLCQSEDGEELVRSLQAYSDVCRPVLDPLVHRLERAIESRYAEEVALIRRYVLAQLGSR